MVFADVKNQEIEAKNIYNQELFYQYLSREPNLTLTYYDQILTKIEIYFKSKKIKILELGCGPGFFLQRAKIKGFEAIGCDFSPYAETAAKAFDLNIVVKDIFNAGFEDSNFDVVITHATHEHLSNVLKISKKLYELLKPEGLYIISGVPNYNTIPIRVFKSFYRNEPPSHINFFDKTSLKLLYKTLDLNILSIKSYGLGIWIWQLWYKLKSLLNRKPKNNIPSEKEQKLNKIDFKTSNFHKLAVWVYVNFHIYGIGRNLEIWGKKVN
jgi:SAM-dependent methyltransferase